ncbi:Glycosyl hydrolases family 16 [Parapedobacter luteus]|uniref:Glycosyl hydrolases family 16 n=1 Tax=Parapedobacter luteus TaxID=623280 RepID=A0A1T5DQ74_9SPHI|nr:glycoside hydrolase family 16 protein [Parapedobacter luteus]SKB73835.1 Glycosyl hydrolases family 16 [Parapedobacter luteus]
MGPFFKVFKTLSIVMVVLCSCGDKALPEDAPTYTTRIVQFSGFDWVVRTSGQNQEGPGPNYFSDSEENVWVDNDGRLHLKIIQKGGNWYCSGVSLRRSLSYGKYVFYVSSRVDELDQNVVAGLFTYMNDEEEIDIEFSRWSAPDNEDAQFAVQPSHLPGNKVRFDLNLTGSYSTHAFDWQPDRIDFVSLRGHGLTPTTDNLIHQWTYTGANIPPDSEERLKINLWLFRGQSPADLNEQELIIERVDFIAN